MLAGAAALASSTVPNLVSASSTGRGHGVGAYRGSNSCEAAEHGRKGHNHEKNCDPLSGTCDPKG